MVSFSSEVVGEMDNDSHVIDKHACSYWRNPNRFSTTIRHQTVSTQSLLHCYRAQRYCNKAVATLKQATICLTELHTSDLNDRLLFTRPLPDVNRQC